MEKETERQIELGMIVGLAVAELEHKTHIDCFTKEMDIEDLATLTQHLHDKWQQHYEYKYFGDFVNDELQNMQNSFVKSTELEHWDIY